MHNPRAVPRDQPQQRADAVDRDIVEVLRTVEDFGSARLELLAWEFCVHESMLGPIWDLAIRTRLVRAAGTETCTGESMHRLATAGAQQLQAASTPPAGGAAPSLRLVPSDAA